MLDRKKKYVHPEIYPVGIETEFVLAQSGLTEGERDDYNYVEW